MSDIDENEYADYFEDQEFQAERGAFERAGGGRLDILGTLIGSGKGSNKLEELNKKLFRLNLSKKEKFQIFLSVFFDKLNDVLGLTNLDLDRMLIISERVQKIEYKNPIAFILGYHVCGEKDIDTKALKEIQDKKILVKFDEVSLPDVIRYARLILEVK